MERRRRILAFGAGALALALVLLVALPFLFRDRVAARVQASLDGALAADVRWEAVGLSLLRAFPNAALRLDDVSLVGRDRFAADTLAHVAQVRVVVSLPSVLRSVRGAGPLVVRSVDVERPALRLRTLEDGAANWDIVSADTAAADAPTAPSRLALELRGLTVRNGTVVLDDARSGLTARVAGWRQSLAGDFRQARFRLDSHTDADSVSVRMAGVPYLSRVRLVVDMALDVDAAAGRASIADGRIGLNELELALAGTVVTGGDALSLDVTFDAPETGIAGILSLLPMLHAQPGFADLRTAGTLALAGSVRGDYGAVAFPAITLTARVRDGWFQYPDLPLPARDLALDLSVANPGGDADSTVIRVDRFHATIGSDPIEGRFALRTPISDPAFDVRVNGRLDLEALNRTLKLHGVEELAGAVAADAAVAARRSDVVAERWDRVAADGTVRATGVVVRTADLPHALRVDEALLRLSPSQAELETFRGVVGSSDIALTGRVDNLLAYALGEDVLRGSARVSSTRFDLNEWRSDDELQAVRVPAGIDVEVDADVQRLIFADLDLRNARGVLRIRDRRATLDGVRLELFGGGVAVHGFYDTSVPERPTFDAALAVTGIDVAEAAASLVTFRALAPAARYAQGRVSTEMRLSGAVGDDMAPVLEVLDGGGSFTTAGLSLTGFPALDQLADALRLDLLRNPTLLDVRSSFQIRDGRLVVSPFDARVGPFTTTIGGSHGFDETIDYTLALQLPRALLGEAANRAVATLATQAGRAGFDWAITEQVTVAVQVGGTVTRPTLSTNFRDATASALSDAGAALQTELDRRAGGAVQRLDSAADEARRRAQEEALRILEEAERQAARLRAEALPIAEAVRREGYDRADALVAQAGNPAARLAARAAADRLRTDADAGADRILREADARAEALLAEARRRADAVAEAGG